MASEISTSATAGRYEKRGSHIIGPGLMFQAQKKQTQATEDKTTQHVGRLYAHPLQRMSPADNQRVALLCQEHWVIYCLCSV